MDIKEHSKPNTFELETVLKSVTESRCFGRSQRQLRLFRYLLEKTISDESHNLKQYAIALDVFERPSSFDQQTDSIVRVEMHRLRRNLTRFNSQSNTFQITIPKGHFNVVVKELPQKQLKTILKSNRGLKYAGVLGTVLTVLAFFSLQKSPMPKVPASTEMLACSELLPNLTIEIEQLPGESVAQIERSVTDIVSQFTNFNLVKEDCRGGATPALQLHYTNGTAENSPTLFVTRFAETIPILLRRIKVTSEKGEKNNHDEDVARSLASILKPYGALSNSMLVETWNSASAKEQYRCLITMHTAYGSELEVEYLSVHKCLKNAVNAGPTSLDIEGGLAASYLDQYLGGYGADTQDALFKAKKILDANEDHWIESAEMSLAKMMYEANRPDYSLDRFRGFTSRVAERYSSNPQVLLTAAGYMGFWIGDWESAQTWSLNAKNIHTDRDHSVFIVDVAYALLNSSSSNLHDKCQLAYTENSSFANIVVNACAKKAADKALIELTEKNLVRAGLDTKNRIAYIKGRNFEPRITDAIIWLNSDNDNK